MWLFHSFVSLVAWVLWLAGALIILVILKYCYEQATEKMSTQKTKRRTGKRKRREEDLEGDGLGFAGGVTYSDSDDDVQQPIEMTAFNRKSKTTKKRSDSGADYKELTPSRSNELQLFDNDEEPQAQPQEVKKKKKKASRGE
jgi:hypothetical protein